MTVDLANTIVIREGKLNNTLEILSCDRTCMAYFINQHKNKDDRKYPKMMANNTNII